MAKRALRSQLIDKRLSLIDDLDGDFLVFKEFAITSLNFGFC